MYAVLFEFEAKQGRFDDYYAIALELRPDVDKIDGFLGIERFASRATPDRYLSLSTWRDEAAICVVMAAEGYPGTPRTGDVIAGAEADFGPHVTLFHAGTARRADGALVSAGGRVLNVCAVGQDLRAAKDRAYAAVGRIDWPTGFCRSDIGWRALG